MAQNPGAYEVLRLAYRESNEEEAKQGMLIWLQDGMDEVVQIKQLSVEWQGNDRDDCLVTYEVIGRWKTGEVGGIAAVRSA